MDDITREMARLKVEAQLSREAKEFCDRRGVAIADGTYPKLMKPGTEGRHGQIKCNAFPMLTKQHIGRARQYSVDIVVRYRIADGQFKTRPLTVHSKNDYWKVELKRRVTIAYTFLWQFLGKELPSRQNIAYDMFKTMYVIGTQFDLGGAGEKTFSVSRNQAEEVHIPFPFPIPHDAIELYVREAGEVDLDIDYRNGEITDIRRVEHIMDLVVNQAVQDDLENHIVFNNTSYLISAKEWDFKVNETPDLPLDSYVGIGCTKNTKIFRNPEGAQPALVIETKKTPFHKVKPMVSKVFALAPKILENPSAYIDRLNKYLKGMVVKSQHLTNHRAVTIKEIAAVSARNATFVLDSGKETTVQQYFAEKYGVQLKYPDLPLFTVLDSRKRVTYHPMEVYEIADNQRVVGQKITPDQIAAVIKCAAVVPPVLEEQNFKNAKSLHLLGNPIIENFGMRVDPNPMIIPARQIAPPCMVYGNRQKMDFDSQKGSWRTGSHYFVPAEIRCWAIYAIEQEQKFTVRQVQEFAKSFFHACRQKGIQMAEPAEMRVLDGRDVYSLVSGTLQAAYEGGCQYAIFITTKKDPEVHPHMKYFERKYGIVTQNITSDTAFAAAGINCPPKRLTMENLVHKANMKNGGLNYVVSPTNDYDPMGNDDLFVGFAMDAGAAEVGVGEVLATKSQATVIGYAANDLAAPLAFSGDYIFQEVGIMEKVNHVIWTLELILGRYLKNKGKNPKRVFIYRNGLQETNFEVVLKYEIPLIKALMVKNDIKDFAYIVPNRLHNVRLMPIEANGQKAPDLNVKPGIVVDDALVSPNITEFYLCAHVARLGTAKVPRYSVLSNESDISLDELQRLTYFLSYGHQIVTGATALPSPVFIARRYAERGRMNLASYHSEVARRIRINPDVRGDDGIPAIIVDPNETDSSDSQQKKEKFYELNQKVSYIGSTLRNCRFNA